MSLHGCCTRAHRSRHAPSHVLLRSYYDYIVVKKCHDARIGYLSVDISDHELERARTAVRDLERKMVETDSSLDKDALWRRANSDNSDWQTDQDKTEFMRGHYDERMEFDLSERRRCQSTLGFLEQRWKTVVPEGATVRKDF